MIKRYFILVLMSVVIFISGCSLKNAISEDDTMDFLFSFEHVYCAQKHLIQDYTDLNNSDWYKGFIVGNNDIPAQRVLAKQLLNNRDEYNVDYKIKLLNNSILTGEFYESIRLLNISNDFLLKFLNSDKNLESFQQFKEITPDLFSSISTLKKVEDQLNYEFMLFKSSEKYTDSKLYDSLLYLDTMCDLGEI